MVRKDIGDFIKKKREETGYTQSDLAKLMSKVNTFRQSISQIENHGTSLTIDKYEYLSDALDVSIDRILRAGKKRVTLLEKYSRLEVDKMILRERPAEPDEYGFTLLDYILNQNNLKKYITLLNLQYFVGATYRNIKVINFLIRNNAFEELDSMREFPLFDHTSDKVVLYDWFYEFPILNIYLDAEVELDSHDDIGLCMLTKLEQEFVSEVMNIRNTAILDILPYRKIKSNKEYGEILYPIIFYYALELDVPFILEYYSNKYNTGFSQQHYDLAKKYKSIKCLKHIYDHNSFEEYRTEENLRAVNHTVFFSKRIKDVKK